MTRWILCAAGLAAVLVVGQRIAVAEETSAPAPLDFSAWQHLPVLHRGRLKPLDTFARMAAETICGSQSPTLSPDGASLEGDAAASEQARQIFPDGKPRRFTAAELLLSWLVEPEKWERIPFLAAGHESLRKDVLQLPVAGSHGQRLKHVSPWQVAHSRPFQAKLAELRAGMKGTRSEPAGLDKKVEDLFEAYVLFRSVTYDASRLAAVVADPIEFHNRLFARLGRIKETWEELQAPLSRLGPDVVTDDLSGLVAKLAESGNKVLQAAHDQKLSLGSIEPLLTEFSRAAADCAARFQALGRELQEQPAPAAQDPAELRERLANLRAATAKTADLAHRTKEAQFALYDNGHSLCLVPSLDVYALEKRRDPKIDDPQTWLSLPTMLLASDSFLEGYPRDQVAALREAFAEVKRGYLDRAAPDRPERFASAMDQFAAAVRALGETITRKRAALPIADPDPTQLAASAYPPLGSTNVEVAYHRANPFFWSWLLAALASACLGLAFGLLRKPMFWAGIGLLLAGQLATLAGLGFRWHITGFVPVTNMFETVVFVALVVGMLGLWFALLPLLWPGLLDAWAMTALPLTWEASPSCEPHDDSISDRTRRTANWLLAIPRLGLGAGLLYVLTQLPYGSGGTVVFGLLPASGSTSPTWSVYTTWMVGLLVLAATVWYLPRAILAALLSPGTVICAWTRQGIARPMEHALARKPYAIVGAAVAFLAAALAYYAPAPVFVREIGSLRPVLRDNFWLLIHVLTITASYGAGALAWGLGNIALGYYLFGRYREPALPSDQRAAQGHRPAGNYVASPEALHRRPPEACATLATFIYRSTQLAVLLLIAGTILGALWADKAWGRFWGWDSKEVWALVSALVYLVILHSRYAGWAGNFGLAVGAVLGASAIIMAWYGVNFILGSGLHAYAEGAGGQLQVALTVALNWLFLTAAAIRYRYETRPPVGSQTSAP